MKVNGYKIEVGAILIGADLRGTDLRFADLRGAILIGADLRGTDLRFADLRYANLRSANLRYADLRGTDLRGTILEGADLRGTILEEEGNMLTATLEMEELTITFTAVRDRVDPDYIKNHEVEELRVFGVRVEFKSLPKELQQELEELAYEVDEWHEVDFG